MDGRMRFVVLLSFSGFAESAILEAVQRVRTTGSISCHMTDFVAKPPHAGSSTCLAMRDSKSKASSN